MVHEDKKHRDWDEYCVQNRDKAMNTMHSFIRWLARIRLIWFMLQSDRDSWSIKDIRFMLLQIW